MYSLKNLKKIFFKYTTDIVLFLILLSAGIKYVNNIQSFLDVQLMDETLYLNNGIYLIDLGLPHSQWAPVYSFWYFFLSLIETDSIALYFLNLQILIITLPITLYAFLRMQEVSKFLAFLIGYFILISSANILVNPKVTHFLIIIIIFSFILLSLTKRSNVRWYIVIFTALISSYVRPEFSISLVLFSIFFLIRIIQTKSFIGGIKNITIFAVLVFVLIKTLGNPLTNGGRAFGAFSQHFSLNWVQWNNSKLNPWTDFKEIIFMNFGDVSNLYEAMISNSNAFFKHLWANISIVQIEFYKLFNHTAFSGNSYKFQNVELLILIIVTAFFLIIKYYKNNLNVFKTIKDNFSKYRCFIFISIIFIVPVLFSVIIIYPRQHYLLIIFIFSFILFIPLLRVPSYNINSHKVLNFVIIGYAISLSIITPHYSKFYTFYNQNNLETIKYVRSLNIESKVNLLEANGGYSTYLGLNYKTIQPYTKDTSFDKFLIDKKINMIIFSGKLTRVKNFSSDSTWNIFLENYEKFGFIREVIPNSGNELFLKNYLIK